MLNYHHLFYFWKVATLGSMARAAAELDVTQPTISEQIRLLEQSLDCRLFDRVGRALVLTESGKTAFDYAARIFAIGEDLSDALTAGAKSSPGLRIGVESGISSRVLANFLPDAPFELTQADAQALFDRSFDLILSAQRTNKLYAHRLLDCGAVFLSRTKCTFGDAPLLFPPEPLRSAVQAWRKKKATTRIAASFDSEDLLLAYAQRTDSIFPAADCKPALSGFHVVRRATELRYRLFAYTRERRPSHPLIRAILAR